MRSKVQSIDQRNTQIARNEGVMSEAGALFSDGAAYERMMGRWSRIAGERFLKWLDAPKGISWLDVGCGNGAFTEVLIGRCEPGAVNAIDPSEAQLAFARTRPGAAMARFRIGDAQALPFADASFDAATMALVITFVPDPLRAATEMRRVVKPGGLVATYMWDIPAGGIPTRAVGEAMKSLGIGTPSAFNYEVSRLENMQELWRKAGLQSIETNVIRIPVAFTSFDDYWDSNVVPVGPRGPLIRSMSAETRERLKARLREQLPIGADGRIAYEGFANAVKGRVPR
jgi:ubiquinone/menaquinone biosynthesis C-methylase UbiE